MTARDAARAVLVMDLVVGRLPHEAAEAKVAAFEQALRAEVLTEAADAVEELALANDSGLWVAEELRRMAAPTTTKEQ